MPRASRSTDFTVLAAGGATMVAQTLLLRAFLTVFLGNEFVLGVALAAWMLFTGAGAAVCARVLRGRPAPERDAGIARGFVALGLATVFGVLLLLLIRARALDPGVPVDLPQAALAATLALAPCCLIGGALFPLLVRRASAAGGTAARTYALEAVGGVAGGVVFNILLLPLLRASDALALLVAFCAAVAAFLYASDRRSLPAAAAALLGAAGLILPLLLDLDSAAAGFLHPGETVLRHMDTPYGALTRTIRAGQQTVYSNGVVLATDDDVTADEEAAHFALVQLRAPRRVLVIGGGVAGIAAEIAKYPGTRMTHLDVDPWVARMTRALHADGAVPRSAGITLLADDPRRAVRSLGRFDAVIVRAPEPLTLQANRLYTREFLSDLARITGDGGIVLTSLPDAADYLGPDARRLHGTLFRTLRSVFLHVVVLPGTRTFYLAARFAPDTRVARRVEARGIATRAVNRWYIDDDLATARGAAIVRDIQGYGGINTDLDPVACGGAMRLWLAMTGGDVRVPALLLCALVALGLVLSDGPRAAMFSAGAWSAGAEVLVLLGFQAALGSLYRSVGLLIAGFMAGLALGGLVGTRLRPTRPRAVILIACVTAALCLAALPAVLTALLSLPAADSVRIALFVAVMAVPAFLVGATFAAATRQADATAHGGGLYAADLWGAALGALGVSTLLLPALGTRTTAWLLAALALAGALRFTLRTRRQTGAC